MKLDSHSDAHTPGGKSLRGWQSWLAAFSFGVLLFETVSGLVITLSRFHAAVEWTVLVHTVLGIATLLPLGWYMVKHWLEYRKQAMNDVLLLGYVGLAALLVCSLSGLVVTVEGLLLTRSAVAWRNTHLISTLAVLITAGLHMLLSYLRRRKIEVQLKAWPYFARGLAVSAAGVVLVAGLTAAYSGVRYVNQLPKDYSYIYGKSRPFAPSLAQTATGGAFDARSLGGSDSCGSSGCHEQIREEWRPSAHRYAAMDTIFQGIQTVMAKQNGPESTRYCAGCHDPISLFSGQKNIFSPELTGQIGYQEGISCLACHSIQKTDIRGNANYTMVQPSEYLYQWSQEGTAAALARNFLIRTYPREHNRLSKRMFKKPEYCAACHKQFIDQEVNRVGWVQLQNQYDNWAASHWNHKGDAKKTVECRECHMPLVASTDPAAGDSLDYNRAPGDRKHRSHRFLASNSFMPQLLKMDGWQKQTELTEEWLRGRVEVPEIQEKWASGPLVKLRLEAPAQVGPGEKFAIRVVMTSNKVGHDYPTGPLDMIQSWVELKVADDRGNVVFSSGRRDEKNFLEPGTFLFKAEPVDQYGNLIDRHNLWEMVGVRYRRSLFPGYSDTVEYQATCPSSLVGKGGEKPRLQQQPEFNVTAARGAAAYTATATLHYRKMDQFLLNYVLGTKAGLTAPVTDIAEATARIEVRGAASATRQNGKAD